jgi:hypothetical protein
MLRINFRCKVVLLLKGRYNKENNDIWPIDDRTYILYIIYINHRIFIISLYTYVRVLTPKTNLTKKKKVGGFDVQLILDGRDLIACRLKYVARTMPSTLQFKTTYGEGGECVGSFMCLTYLFNKLYGM